MIGLDTNVLVRYVTQDDPQQSALATRLVDSLDEHRPGFVSVVALVELHWVLRRAYRVSRATAASVIRTLLDARELLVEESDAVRRAVDRLVGDADFADALVSELGRLAGCEHTVTFDRVAARLPGMELVPGTTAGPPADRGDTG